ncbi:MAG: hypothetical protein KDB14_01375, partial [Planctomycetales bacterium]|nr:hypothetical protein [Planctomycetales bacterium]
MPVGVSLLTGGRPELLSRTIAALQARAPWLLAEHFVQVVINGADDPTCDYVSSLDFVDDCVVLEGARMPIGPATSLAVLRLLKNVNVEYVLHLEDDWEASGADESWLARAGDILERSPMVGQVRLRDRHEPVATRHALSGSLMEWRLEPGYLLAESAHFTFNPGLIRAADARRIFPCQDEREAQANFFALGLQTAQLTPGTFRHIGGGQSLRERLLDVEKHRFRQSPQRFPAE